MAAFKVTALHPPQPRGPLTRLHSLSPVAWKSSLCISWRHRKSLHEMKYKIKASGPLLSDTF